MSHKLIPFGDRILVKRREVGEKLGKEKLIIASDYTKEQKTDIADVMFVPDDTFADKELISNAEAIIAGLSQKAQQGDDEALIALLRFKTYLNQKALKEGDMIMMSKYSGINFYDNEGRDLTVVNMDDIIAVIVKDEPQSEAINV